MSSGPSVQEIVRDAGWLAQALDPQGRRILFVRMDREAYRSASFLDDRLFQQQQQTQVVSWGEVIASLSPESRRDARWIFHIGHVGSTLVARLLGELPDVLSIREPRLLRDLLSLSAEQRAELSPAIQSLYSRTFEPNEIALVKATSFVSEIVPEVVGQDGRTVFLFASPRNYIASILAGPNSLQELSALAGFRAQRMEGRVVGLDDQQRSAAHLAAAAWACEMTSLEAAASAMPNSPIRWDDFDGMLDDMTGSLREVAKFLGISASDEQVASVARGPLMSRYSKGLEHEYSPGLRRDLIADAARHHQRDIDSALVMLSQAAENSPLLARAMARVKET